MSLWHLLDEICFGSLLIAYFVLLLLLLLSPEVSWCSL